MSAHADAVSRAKCAAFMLNQAVAMLREGAHPEAIREVLGTVSEQLREIIKAEGSR